jgi:hypothetical protein
MSTDRTSSTTREDDTPAPATSDDTGRNTEQASGQQTGPDNDRAHQRAETLTRDQYADAVRADGGPISRDNSRDHREPPEQEPRDQAERRADQDRAEPRDRETYADEARADHSAAEQQDRQEASHQPETVTFENKDIEITHNAADGIWIEGLPGDPPTRIGDLVQSAEDPAQGRGEKLRKELNKEAGDISDTTSKWADSVQEILDPPRPTHSMTHSPAPEIALAGPQQGINAGQGAEAFLTVTIVAAAAIHKLHERLQHAWEH